MVSRPTVLIVGAGGSIPYGFPSGRTLMKEVIEGLSQPKNNLIARIIQAQEYNENDMQHFARELNLSGHYSIDAFLENRAEFISIGKRAIAAALIPRERDDQLFGSDDSSDWYRYLYNRLVQNIKRGANQPLTIITFNYDRSLDHFLYISFKHTYKVDGPELRKKLANLRIIHVHGLLGHLPLYAPTGEPVRKYSPIAEPSLIMESANDLRIVHEAAENDPEYMAAREILEKADRICMLGFGYSPTNISRLLAGNWRQRHTDHRIVGSAFGLTHSEKSEIQDCFNRQVALGASDQDCLRFLRENVDVIN